MNAIAIVVVRHNNNNNKTYGDKCFDGTVTWLLNKQTPEDVKQFIGPTETNGRACSRKANTNVVAK